MRLLYLIIPALVILAIAYSCSSSTENTDPAPDFSNLITGTYAYTTTQNGNTTGAGAAIISKEDNTSIRITLEDGVSFYADKLQKIDDDMVMEVPSQDVDYYQLEARFAGTSIISRGDATFHGVYFGRDGDLKMGLQITIGSRTDNVLLVLSR